ncbi:hypothetical protein SPRG_08908 [Saprolegnia parasitica CBS 223.65]|uniref:RNase III domain-containing protein n=1 Tax=Saprolegnia parasitica (strain CBS 223.65) TaxID=695850 RepID=A0A067C4B0_SAPPC|nr:hypothetical protein SPRG_08908 [Saprolegnia parasitica CBS 223.65]KDO25609.1 hypothetical protein SPRG_08908 [Saprolegnia parasitica CBS 223.65]|eukprot:XP_012203642.1 hypothetical protein SPRG_08908 [Saprolegnia parasitica CBS 223.65]
MTETAPDAGVALYRIESILAGDSSSLGLLVAPPLSDDTPILAAAGVQLVLLHAALAIPPPEYALYQAFTVYACSQVLLDAPPLGPRRARVTVVPLTPTGAIDDALVRRCCEPQTREEKLVCGAAFCELPAVIVYQDVPYIADAVSPELTPGSLLPTTGKTYAETARMKAPGTSVDMAQHLYRARQARAKPGMLAKATPPKKRTYIHLIPQLCTVHPLPCALWHDLKRLPTILYLWEKDLAEATLRRRWQWPHPLTEALTAASAKLSYSNERLAFLGDGVLKLVLTIDAIQSGQWQLTDAMRDQRLRRLQNATLCAVAESANLLPYVDLVGFHGSWFQPLLSDTTLPPPEDALTPSTRIKTYATVVEALLGAAYDAAGVAGAMTMAHHLELVSTRNVDLPRKAWALPAPTSCNWQLGSFGPPIDQPAVATSVAACVSTSLSGGTEAATDGPKLLGEALQYAATAIDLYATGTDPGEMTRRRHFVTRASLGARLVDTHVVPTPAPSATALGAAYESVLGAVAANAGVEAALAFATAWSRPLLVSALVDLVPVLRARDE